MYRIIIFIFFQLVITAQIKTPLTPQKLWELSRITTYDISPDSESAVISAVSFDIELNKGNYDIYIAKGGETLPLIATKANETNPVFLDNENILYEKDGSIYKFNLLRKTEEIFLSIYSGASAPVVSLQKDKILFVSDVFADCPDQDCNKAKDDSISANKVKASLFTELMFRIWNRWRGPKFSHLFIYDIKSKEYRNIIPGVRSDVPPLDLGGNQDYSFSPDGKEIAYTLNPDSILATSTNNEIFIVASDGSSSPVRISQSKGNDNNPVYSPNGKYIAFLSMKRAGFEADKRNLIIYDRQSTSLINISENIDLSIENPIWSNDSKRIYFTAANEIYSSIYEIEIESGKHKMLLKDGYNNDLKLSACGSKLFFKRQTSVFPTDIYSMEIKTGKLLPLSILNKNKLADIEMNAPETFSSVSMDGTEIQSMIIKPPFFNKQKKYPMLFLIHGGPQGHWSDDFHFRWNMQLFAAYGYVVIAPNPRGSVGYGQKFTDEISGDWGGRPYDDLMSAYDYAVRNFNFIDEKNTFAAGASYGGYMINWLAGHTDRFNALVSHAGVFNLESMYGTTEELWFAEWENKGTPWENRQMYERFSPHRFVQNIKTPMLVIHGANDFRVPEGQAFELFTSLQRLGVKSKFLYFPDETHFVSKPQNALLWWKTIFEWFGQNLNN